MGFHSKIKPKEDKFETYLKTPDLQKLVNQAVKSYEDSGFLIENAPLLTISKVASVFLGIVSVLCSVPMITNFLSLMVMGKKVIAPQMEIGAAVVVFGVLSLGFLALMEIWKQKLAQKVAQTYWKKRTFSIGFLVFWLLMLGFSAWSAIEGSAEVAMFSAYVAPEKLQNTNELASSYDSQIKDINKEIADVKKDGSGYTWNGALTDKGRAQIDKLSKQRDKLISNKEGSVNAAKLENATMENEAMSQGGKNANMVRFFVGMLELFILAACIYPQYYNYMVYMELEFDKEAAKQFAIELPKFEYLPPPIKKEIGTEGNEGRQAPVAKIGFHTQTVKDTPPVKDTQTVKDTDLFQRLVNENKEARLGTNIKCPTCEKSTIKINPSQAYCCTNCRVKGNEFLKGYNVTNIIKGRGTK